SGDDLLPGLDGLVAAGHPLTNLDTGEPLATVRPRLVCANAYLGARPIVRALELGAAGGVTGPGAGAAPTPDPAGHAVGPRGARGAGGGGTTGTGWRRAPWPAT